MRHLGELIDYCLVIALGIILVVNLSLFWLRGEVRIYEHNRVVLGLETALGVAIICFGLAQACVLIVKHRKGRCHEA